ncbi:MAG: DUF4139 domain-containing protein [Filimonas sp.]|nr:DUF4139 domain-containing protein [Filimonas sp.]
MKRYILTLWLLLAGSTIVLADDNKSTTRVSAALKSATVYRNGAEMQHKASAELKQGNNELIIENISNKIDINSIQIKAPSAVAILSVEFSNNYLVNTEWSPRMTMLTDSLASAKKNSDKIQLALTNATDLLDVLKANRDIKGTQTGLSVAELMKLMDYYKLKSAELQNEIALLKDRKTKNEEKISVINAQIDEEENKNTSTTGRLVLQVSSVLAGKYEFDLSYIAQNAYWTPYYDVRVENIKNPIKIIYKAKVVQTTGIDWKQVKLSLSTATPSQWGNAPTLQQWYLGYINPIRAMDKSLAANTLSAALAGKIAGTQQLDEVVVTAYAAKAKKSMVGAASTITDIKPLYVVNGKIMAESEYAKINPSSIKDIKQLKDASATAIYGSRAANGVTIVTLKDGLDDYVSVADNSMNVTFDIDMPYDVPTNGKEQTAVLKTIDVPSYFEHYAIPKLDKDAYILSKVTGWEKLNLLPGQANIIFEGTYVGKSFIDPSSTQDTLNLTLGLDKRVAVKREKMIDYSSVKFLGSNKLQKLTYEITVRNNKNEAVNMLLKDQFPLTTNKDIEVELIDAGDAKVNTEIGVLNWQLTLAPGESKKVRYTYSVKYPKDKTVNL